MGETVGLKTKVLTADRSRGVAGEGVAGQAAEFKGRNLGGKMYILTLWP